MDKTSKSDMGWTSPGLVSLGSKDPIMPELCQPGGNATNLCQPGELVTGDICQSGTVAIGHCQVGGDARDP